MQHSFVSEANIKYIESIKEIKNKLPSFFKKTKRSLFIKNRIAKYGKSNKKKINYEKDYLAFNQAYFFKNLYKTFIAIAFLKNKLSLNKNLIFDIGSGAGTFSLAFSALIGADNTEYQLIDKCSNQLKLATSLLGPKNHKYQQRSFPSNEEPNIGVRLSSYWACEQPLNILLDEEMLIRSDLIGEGIILIDYPQTITLLINKIPPNMEYVSFSLRIIVEESISSIINESLIKVHGLAIFKKQ